jgi:hypothetical protein
MYEPEFDFEHEDSSSIVAMLESAARFGLTPDEIWEALIELPDRMPEDARALYIDQLTRELATRLLQKERSF